MTPETRLSDYPDLREKLNTVFAIIQGSCPLGKKAIMSLVEQRVQFLVLTDQEMDERSSPKTMAYYSRGEPRRCLGIRDSALLDENKIFDLIEQVSHESIHCSQEETHPHEIRVATTNPLDPDFTRSTLKIEQLAFAGTCEIILRLVLLEAQNRAMRTNAHVSLYNTPLMEAWRVYSLGEADFCLNKFVTCPQGMDKDARIQAVRNAADDYFDMHLKPLYVESCERHIARAGPELPSLRL